MESLYNKYLTLQISVLLHCRSSICNKSFVWSIAFNKQLQLFKSAFLLFCIMNSENCLGDNTSRIRRLHNFYHCTSFEYYNGQQQVRFSWLLNEFIDSQNNLHGSHKFQILAKIFIFLPNAFFY